MESNVDRYVKIIAQHSTPTEANNDINFECSLVEISSPPLYCNDQTANIRNASYGMQ